ncbi:MAG: hypothetical protein P1U32_02450 [Legionellaceae bacterium]|nr:hypothetical protein [Legionellaceae bacterium]
MRFFLKFYQHLNTIKFVLLFSVSAFFSEPLLAGMAGDTEDTAHNYLDVLKSGWFTVQLGGYWRNLSNEQYIHIEDVIGNRMTVLDTNPKNGLFGVGYFIDGQTYYERFRMSLGANWFYLPQTRTAGIVFQENEFRNLSYEYNITQYPLYAVAKSTINTAFPGKDVTLNVGIGPNFIRTHDYKESPILTGNNVVSSSDPMFSGKTTTVFSVTAGAGIQVAELFGKAPLECGYQFFYLGEGKFNRLNDQTQNTLKTGTLYANAVMCSILV